ncbi:WD40/YVTN/BNR-like repeat-containing protein [Natrarchaeobius oligotrophus]|uniref:Sialidase n=1 Tax=Natrarchaeobius chitinivorans TaxID=1679083 RepID=A0A3N6PS95_NATCH|nr:sialidase [Natrarchaeobius chitinivorans]RQH02366.1 sialidase [Natrarchaeobius chitinivorans]
MALLMGTDDGLYRAERLPFENGDAERVLDCGRVTQVEDLTHAEGVFVCSTAGAFRSRDGGRTWDELDVPKGGRYWFEGDSVVFSLQATADGALYAGTNLPALYRSFDDGETWHELRGFQDLPSRPHWESPEDPKRARIRNIESAPNTRNRLIVSIEVGGVHVSEDGGETWIDRRENIEDDVHHVLPLTADCWLAATGYFDLELEHVGLQTGLGHATGWGGLYRTTDAGKTWKRLDPGNEYSYIRRAFTHDGTVFFSGANGAPPAWENDDHEAALFESTNFGRTFERVSYPGEPNEVIEDWVVDDDGTVLCGGGLFDIPDPRLDVDGRILRRDHDGEYETVGTVPSSVGRIELV